MVRLIRNSDKRVIQSMRQIAGGVYSDTLLEDVYTVRPLPPSKPLFDPVMMVAVALPITVGWINLAVEIYSILV